MKIINVTESTELAVLDVRDSSSHPKEIALNSFYVEKGNILYRPVSAITNRGSEYVFVDIPACNDKGGASIYINGKKHVISGHAWPREDGITLSANIHIAPGKEFAINDEQEQLPAVQTGVMTSPIKTLNLAQVCTVLNEPKTSGIQTVWNLLNSSARRAHRQQTNTYYANLLNLDSDKVFVVEVKCPEPALVISF